MTDSDPNVIKSPLSQTFTSDGITVNVDIYWLDGSEGWTLELVDENWNSILWDELFLTDAEAWQEFITGVEEIGLAKLLEPDDDDPPMVTIH